MCHDYIYYGLGTSIYETPSIYFVYKYEYIKQKSRNNGGFLSYLSSHKFATEILSTIPKLRPLVSTLSIVVY
jgi:hypothetical protein